MIVAAVVLVCVLFVCFHTLRKFAALREVERTIERREAAPNVLPAGFTPGQSNALLGAIERAEGAFSRASNSRTLLYFDLAGNLRPVERAFARCSGILRPFAGWMLLAGIVVTLSNLRGSVGNLATAFGQMTPASAVGSSSASPPVQDRERKVTEGMQFMARNASQAFTTSLWFIALALCCMVITAALESKARQLLGRYEAWAAELYGYNLPGHLPLTEGNIADRLTQAVTGMGDVVEQLRGAATALGNLEPLLSSMRDVNDSIQQTMQQLPHDLRSSMSTVTSEMVKELSGTLSESTEHTKKILAIYGEQELRVRSLNTLFKEQDKVLTELRSAHGKLEALPQQVLRLQEAAHAIADSNKEICAAVDLLPPQTRLLSEAAVQLAETNGKIVSALAGPSQTLLERSSSMSESEHRLIQAVEQISEATASLKTLVQDAREGTVAPSKDSRWR